IDGGGSTVAVYTPDGSITGNGSIDLSGDPFASGVHFTVDFANFEPVDVSGMSSATVMAPLNSANALVFNAGVDSETGAIPAIAVSGTTGTGLKGIEAALLFNNTNVLIDTSATTGAGPNSIAVKSVIPLGHKNANLTLKTSASGSVVFDASLATAGA